LADKAFKNPQTAIDAIITEELGLTKKDQRIRKQPAASFVLLL
jgi:hypothetical protein